MRYPVEVVKGAVKRSSYNPILKSIFNDILQNGLNPEEVKEWYKVNCPWPYLRQIPEITGVSPEILMALNLEPYDVGIMCEPQIIWHWPDWEGRDYPPPHIDEEPEWAKGRQYSRIVGLALTDWYPENGTLRYWAADPDQKPSNSLMPRDVLLNPGDIVIIKPDVPHASGLNQSAMPRIGLYYRWLRMVDTPL